MQKVMQALERYNLYFLDSVTIGNTQAMRAAQGTGVKVIKRKVSSTIAERSGYPLSVQPRYRFGAAQRFRHCYRPPAPDDGARAAADGV
jgi:hypothetical protein